MSFGGFGGGAPMFGGGGHGASPGGGLPFAGIPSELQEGVDKLLAREPEHADPDAVFNYTGADERDRNLTLRQLVLRHWRLGLWAVVLVSVVSVLGQVGPLLIEYAIDHGMPPQAHGSFAVVAACAGVFALATAISALAQRSQVRASGRLAAGVMYDLRVKVFAQLQRLGLDYYTQEKAGVVMTRMTADIENLQQLLQDGLAQLVAQALTMIVITAILFAQNVELTLITLALMVPLLTVSTIWFTRASQRAYLRVRDAIAGVLGDLSESLQGMRTVAAFNRQARNVVAHRSVVGEYQDASNRTAQINAIYGPGTQLLGYLGQGALLAIGGEMVLHHQLPLGALIAYFLYLNRFFAPIQLLVQQYTTFQQGQASVVKLRTLFRTEPNTPQAADAAVLAPVAGEIRFDHVSFGYFPGQEVLHDVTLAIAPGESVAFVGETGAGKSTIAKLITRFYDPTAGRVLIDGVDLRTVTLDSLRRQLGVVPQEPFLFAGSLRENIAFARPDASDAEVWEAIDAVGLHEVVERMPDGLDTVVHERGQSLSSGERQLIALARAFHARPRVLVLDEATSNLDLMSETKVEAALDVLLEGRTAVLIAHRLSTAMKADRIVVVDGGRIVETGSHEELVARGGRYAEMYETWSAQLELAA
ncbi:ABC transporter ATP-binding protein [Conexibacter sp. S30A1]|uniref:ABC transporter ATP-binding protein n=1 Tax=Conexibacter sp. S30A1 TaxID=2937800 RepID=UPI00273A6AC2|nr:ABC transporter ATP-binding protein [Conexibacter sp. S30A1]